MVLRCLKSEVADDWGHSLSSLMWLSRRGIRVSRLEMKINISRVRGCNILVVDTSDLMHIGLQDCINITEQCIVDVIKRCPKLRSITLSGDDTVSSPNIGKGPWT